MPPVPHPLHIPAPDGASHYNATYQCWNAYGADGVDHLYVANTIPLASCQSMENVMAMLCRHHLNAARTDILLLCTLPFGKITPVLPKTPQPEPPTIN